MKWYLNRTGQAEGPFDEPQLVEMIRSGQVSSGNVAQDGSSDWVPLANHPPFAEAMRASSPAISAAPGQPMGAPGAPAAPPGSAGPPPSRAKKKGGAAGKVIGLLVVLLVLGGGGFAVWKFLLSGTSAKLAGSVPADVQVYIEAPDVRGAIEAFAAMGIVNDKSFKPAKTTKALKEGMKEAFDIKKDDAANIVDSLDSFAVATRDAAKKGESATLIQFSDGSGMEKLLASERFNKEDKIGENGRQYGVDRMDAEDEDREDFKLWTTAFADISYDKDSKSNILVWFADQKLLVIGHPDMVEDIGAVLEDGKESLTTNERFGKAKFDSGSQLLTFVDSEVLDDVKGGDEKVLIKGFFKDIEPFTVSVGFHEPGVVMSSTGQLQGRCLPEEGIAEAAELDIYTKLPKETVAYIAMSTKTELGGKELRKSIEKLIRCVDKSAGEAMDEALDELGEAADFDAEKLFDAVGDQLVIGVVVGEKLEIDPEKLDELKEELQEQIGVFVAFHIGDKDAAEKIMKTLRQKVFEDGPMKDVYEVDKKGKGFKVEPTEEAAEQVGEGILEVRFVEDYVVLAAGGEDMVKKITGAFKSGKKSLAENEAHQTALESVKGSPHLVFWTDAGRAGQMALDFAEEHLEDELEKVTKLLEEGGLSLKSLHLKGKSRINSVIAFGFENDGESIRYRMDMLNGLAPLAAGGVFAAFDGGGGNRRRNVDVDFPVPDSPTTVAGGGDTIRECEEYFEMIENDCPANVRSSMESSVKSLRNAIELQTTAAGRQSMADACKRSKAALASVCP